MISPTSKVQGPKSGYGETQVPSIEKGQAEPTDPGPWTLDFGLRVSDLRKSFVSPAGENIQVLRGVSFEGRAAEVIAVVGSSGAGKSTLLHLLGGLDSPDHGNINAGEFAIDRAKSNALAQFRNKHIGFVFQFHHLLPDLTAAENVSLPLRISRVNPGEAMRRARAMLQTVGLEPRSIESVVGRLSGGEQQRVAVCRALISQPRFVLADEPTGNLDATVGTEIANSLISYAKDNQAVVVVATHNSAFAEMCDRTLLLTNGRISENS